MIAWVEEKVCIVCLWIDIDAALHCIANLKQIHGLVVADVLLWRNKHLSAGIVAGATFVWFLFEVLEYHFLPLMCHISIVAMLVLFIWSNLEALVHR